MKITSHLQFWPKGLPHSLTLPVTPVHDNLAVTARRYPDKTAIYYYGRTISYAFLWHQVEAFAGYLQVALGVKAGQRVALYLQNSPQYIIAYYAILRIDAVVVPMNPMNLTAELDLYLRDSGAKVIVAGQELLQYVQPLFHHLRHVVVAAYSDYALQDGSWSLPNVVARAAAPIPPDIAEMVTAWTDALASGYTPGPSHAGANDIAVLPYTSGTTGIAKGCIHTHSTTQANIVGGALWSGLTTDSVVLSALPLFHVTGMEHSMNAPIFCGATIVLMTRWDREVAAAMIQRYQCSHWKCISTMLIDFLNTPNLRHYALSSLCYIGGGGASVPAAIAEKCRDILGIDYIEGYGLTETMSTSHVNPDHRAKAQCAGIPTFDVDARVVHPETLAELGVREEGEIVVRGPQVFKGYWNRPDEDAKAFVDIEGEVFFRTGDVGYYDEDGYFFIVDRAKRMINVAGFKVWPTEVESILYKHPDIEQVCVIGVPDERRGQTVKALVVLHPDRRGALTERDIIDWAKSQMAAYKYPRIVEFVDSLPMSGSGKILWRQLQAEAMQKTGENKL
jgi:fatty-acyl-CoA synthase